MKLKPALRKGLGIGRDGHAAGFCEFHGISHKVGNDLPEPSGIAHDGLRNGTGYLKGQPDTLFACFHPQDFHDFLNNGIGMKGHVFNFKPAGFDFGEVQNIVNEVQ